MDVLFDGILAKYFDQINQKWYQLYSLIMTFRSSWIINKAAPGYAVGQISLFIFILIMPIVVDLIISSADYFLQMPIWGSEPMNSR